VCQPTVGLDPPEFIYLPDIVDGGPRKTSVPVCMVECNRYPVVTNGTRKRLGLQTRPRGPESDPVGTRGARAPGGQNCHDGLASR